MPLHLNPNRDLHRSSQLSSPEVRRTAAQFKHARDLAAARGVNKRELEDTDHEGDDDEGDVPMCLMNCANGRAPSSCDRAEEVDKCAKNECSDDEYNHIKPIINQVKECVCKEEEGMYCKDEDDEKVQKCKNGYCGALGIVPIDTTLLVDPFDYIHPWGGELRRKDLFVMPAGLRRQCALKVFPIPRF